MKNEKNTSYPSVDVHSCRSLIWILFAPLIFLNILAGCENNTASTSDNDEEESKEEMVFLTQPDDPIFLQRWYLLNLQQTIGENVQETAHADIQALEIREISRAENVVIAVLDAGVASAHPNFKDRLVYGWDFAEDDSDPKDVRANSIDVANLFQGTAVADAVLSIIKVKGIIFGFGEFLQTICTPLT